jgi:hypothetical protein
MGARERERSLQNELEALSTQLCQQEQVNIDLMFKQDQMLGRVHHEQVLTCCFYLFTGQPQMALVTLKLCTYSIITVYMLM